MAHAYEVEDVKLSQSEHPFIRTVCKRYIDVLGGEELDGLLEMGMLVALKVTKIEERGRDG